MIVNVLQYSPLRLRTSGDLCRQRRASLRIGGAFCEQSYYCSCTFFAFDLSNPSMSIHSVEWRDSGQENCWSNPKFLVVNSIYSYDLDKVILITVSRSRLLVLAFGHFIRTGTKGPLVFNIIRVHETLRHNCVTWAASDLAYKWSGVQPVIGKFNSWTWLRYALPGWRWRRL